MHVFWSNLQNIVWVACCACEATALVLLVIRGLARRYIWFSIYLAGIVASDITLRVVGRNPATLQYAWAWIAAQFLVLTLLTMACSEIVWKLPERYPGFGSFGRSRLRGLLRAAILIAATSAYIEAVGFRWNLSLHMVLPLAFALRRIVTTVLAGYLALTILFTLRFPAPMERNLKTHMRLLAIYTAALSAAALCADAIGGHATAAVNIALLSCSSILALLWAALLTPRGEIPPEQPEVTEEDIAATEARGQELIKIAQRALRDGSPQY